MALLDWLIIGVSTLGLVIFSLYSVKHMKGVADFLAAGRLGGRYLLTISGGMSGIGAVSAVAIFEMYYQAGFVPCWWSLMSIPVGVVIIMTGYVYYRFRETRALTMAQFYEMRYSRKFRIYAGIVHWVSGVVNFAIFPIVEARFFVWFCGFPVHYASILGFQVDLTSAVVMLVTMGISLVFAVMGGQITVMVTDCAQGIYCMFAYLFIVAFLMLHFGWSDLVVGLKLAPAHASMLNPYDTAQVKDFNIWYFLIGALGTIYGYMSWQGSAAYQSSGKNPHEQQMGAIIGSWRTMVQGLMLLMIPACAFAFLHLPQYADGAAHVEQVLKGLPGATLQGQLRVPVALAHILPAGLKGLFATIMLFFLITTQDTYMHSWGTMFIQDVVLPFRKEGFTPKTQILLLRLSIAFVALFAFVFGLFFKQTEYILMFFAITGAIVTGAGACIVLGVYWPRGTAGGAWVSMTVGWVLALSRIALQQIGPYFKDVTERSFGLRFMDMVNGVNSQVVWFWIMLVCLACYVIVSLCTRNEEGFSMERMLHRGKYEVKGEHVHVRRSARSLWQQIVGVTDEFTFSDRVLAYVLMGWNAAWFLAFLVGTVINLTVGLSQDTWAQFWHLWMWMQLGIGVPATLWFTIGGIADLRELFHSLHTLERDSRDDGRVVHQQRPTQSDP